MRPDGVLLIAVGGAVGTLIRYLISESFDSAFLWSLPWPTLFVNVVGCGLLAMVTSPQRPRTQQRVLGTGFCGGLTTFSTFSVEVGTMVDAGDLTTAIIYLVASVVTGLAVFVGVRAVTRSEATA